MLGFDPAINSPQFIADFIVTHMRPNIEVMKQKIGRFYYQGRIIRLFPPEEVPDLLSFARRSQLEVINSISDPLPSWFNKEEYVSRTQSRIKNYLSENGDLSSAVHEIEKQPDFENRDSVKIFRDAVILLGDKMRDWFSAFENYSSDLLLESDIPVHYFLISKEAELAQISNFEIYAKGIRTLDAKLGIDSIATNFVKFSQNAKAFKKEISPLLGVGRALTNSISRINLYLDLRNSSNIDEMFTFTPYMLRNIDSKVFGGYMSELEASLTKVNDELFDYQGSTYKPVELLETTRHFREDLANVILA